MEKIGNNAEGDYKWVFAQPVVEFATVAKEYCSFIEKATSYSHEQFVQIAPRLLAFLYIKASVLNTEGQNEALDEPLQEYIDEYTYNDVWENISGVIGEGDEYLRAAKQDFQNAEEMEQGSISEDLADIYQVLGNFCNAYKMGIPEIMNDAVLSVTDDFAGYWGRILCNAQSALHNLLYYKQADDKEADENNEEQD